jgi:GST-like protein
MGSPNVLKIVLALEELGLRWNWHYVDVFRGEQFRPEFVALNPNCKVPVIVDPQGPDGAPITLNESGAILLYLAEKSGRLLPGAARDRAMVTQWLMFQMASIGPMFGQNFHFRVFAAGTNDYARSRYATEAQRIMDVLEGRLSQSPYLGGAEYSIADIAAWPWLWLSRQRAPDGGARPKLADWVERIGERPAAKKTVEFRATMPTVDFKALAKENPDALDRYFGRGRWARA